MLTPRPVSPVSMDHLETGQDVLLPVVWVLRHVSEESHKEAIDAEIHVIADHVRQLHVQWIVNGVAGAHGAPAHNPVVLVFNYGVEMY